MNFGSLVENTQAVYTLGGMAVFSLVVIATAFVVAKKYSNKEEHKGIHQILEEQREQQAK